MLWHKLIGSKSVVQPRVTLFSSAFGVLSSSTNLTLTWGSDIEAGDVLVVVFGSSSTGTNFSPPSGWNRILRQVNNDNDSIAVHQEQLAAGGSGSVTFSIGTLGTKLYTFTIWRGAAQAATAYGSSNNTASTDILAPSATVSSGQDGAAVMCAFFMDDATSSLTITNPSSLDDLGSLQVFNNERYMRSGIKLNNTAGETGTFTAVASQSRDSVGATIRIQ